MSFDSVAGELYPGLTDVETFAQWTADVLAPFDFRPDNALAVVGVCRDELMFTTEQALHRRWGPVFDMSSLGAMVFLGRTGFAAAGHHAPGIDGRRRYVFIVLPHIGIDENGTVGVVRRRGQTEPGTACGALVALRDECVRGPLRYDFDRHDIEMSLLRRELAGRIGGQTAPDLATLTELARLTATEEVTELGGELAHAVDTDIAVISGIVVHGPDIDRASVIEAWVMLGSDGAHVSLL